MKHLHIPNLNSAIKTCFLAFVGESGDIRHVNDAWIENVGPFHALDIVRKLAGFSCIALKT